MSENYLTIGPDAQLTALALLEASLELDHPRIRELWNGAEDPEATVWAVLALSSAVVSLAPDPAGWLHEQRTAVLVRAVGGDQ